MTENMPNQESKTQTPAALAPCGCSAAGSTLAGVVERIRQCAEKYKTDYGIEPFDVCLGPAEFQLIYMEGRSSSAKPSAWHYQIAPMFYKGMRVRLMNTPGILVGTLTS